jgi:hypothetical protein
MDLNWKHALILFNSQYGNWNIMLTCLMPSLCTSITTKNVFVYKVNSLVTSNGTQWGCNEFNSLMNMD